MSDDAITTAMTDIIPQGTIPHTDEGNSTATDRQESPPTTNGKRKAETELEREDRPAPGDDEESERRGAQNGEANQSGTPLSKNQLKRLKRQQQYEEYKEDRKSKRKEKRHARQDRKRAERDEKIAAAKAAGLDLNTVLRPQGELWQPRQVPIAFVVDCDFEQYMREPEIVSLSSQITRSYSQNRRATYQANLWITSFGGQLKTRFETAMKSAHHNWRGAYFTSEDFKTAAETIKSYTRGEVIDVIKPSADSKRSLILDETAPTAPDSEDPEPELADDVDQSVVYLTSESPYTLERLEANTTYVIGGIVDRNREKGLCYNRAKEKKVRTARLPIGEFMAMQSRYVLTTNQVVEIMAKWLECGNWGEAFLNIIPKRKGGVLKPDGGIKPQGDDDGEEDAHLEEGAQDDAAVAAAVPSKPSSISIEDKE